VLYNIIPLIIIVVSLGGILYILFRKLPDVSKLDVDDLLEVKQARARNSLLEDRLLRKIKDLKLFKQSGKVNQFFSRVAQYSKLSKRRIQEQIEARMHVKQIKYLTEKGENGTEEVIGVLLAEAETLKQREAFDEAEKKYLNIIKLSPRSVEAYRGLGDVYMRERDWSDTEATLEHLLKIAATEKKILVEDFADLAEVKKNLQKMPEALHYIEKAREMEPNNPKYLDFQLEACLACENIEKAKESLRNLRAINPENKKLQEYGDRIKNAYLS